MPTENSSPAPDDARLVMTGRGLPKVQAIIDQQEAIIELQTSALFAVGDDASGTKLAEMFTARKDLILEAAHRLYREGFFQKSGDRIEIALTAIDL